MLKMFSLWSVFAPSFPDRILLIFLVFQQTAEVGRANLYWFCDGFASLYPPNVVEQLVLRCWWIWENYLRVLLPIFSVAHMGATRKNLQSHVRCRRTTGMSVRELLSLNLVVSSLSVVTSVALSLSVSPPPFAQPPKRKIHFGRPEMFRIRSRIFSGISLEYPMIFPRKFRPKTPKTPANLSPPKKKKRMHNRR